MVRQERDGIRHEKPFVRRLALQERLFEGNHSLEGDNSEITVNIPICAVITNHSRHNEKGVLLK
jgi:hypothetical protein